MGYVHAIAHQFGSRYHTPHGLANAIVLPYILEASRPAIDNRLAELAVACELGDTATESHSELAGKFIGKVQSMNEYMNIPKHLDALTVGDIAMIAEKALKEAHYTYAVPHYITQSECEEILHKMVGK